MDISGHRRIMRKFTSESFPQLPIIRRSLLTNFMPVAESRGDNDGDNDVAMVSPPQSPTQREGGIDATMTTLPTTSDNVSMSDFDISRMPTVEIFRRTLYPYSVHQTADKWTATISRPDPLYPSRIKHLVFEFRSEREAHKFCKSYAPPKFRTSAVDNNNNHNNGGVVADACMLCATNMSFARNCRNCGTIVCEMCSRRWGFKMIPKTYLSFSGQTTPQTVRVCKSCDWLSNAFCMALLQGRYQDALTLYETVSKQFKI
jgi:FYVE zinc finger